MSSLFRWSIAVTLLSAFTCSVLASATSGIEIPFQKFVLDNGLRVIVHEDHKAPIVAVNVWYHVGSKNEPVRRSGFAHLFEHLMFNGTENFNDDYFQVLERVGATDLNGTTNEDRTNYFQNVPTSAIDLTLWMESDRMGHLLGAVDQATLDEQRGVVQNEKRQSENQPYAVAYELITKATWPAAHPYSHSVIGSMEDLESASLDDVKEWFKTYYGPSNAVLVIAGDIETERAHALAKKYFGDISPGPPVSRHSMWVPKLRGEQRQIAEDRVPQGRLYFVWNIPPVGTADELYLDLATDILSSGKTSRLYKRLVYDDQIATNVSAYIDQREIASQLVVEVTARPGEDLKKVEQATREEIERFLQSGPTGVELQRVTTQLIANFTRGIERIGGFGGKSDILAISEVYGGSPDAYKKRLHWAEAATTTEVHNAVKRWMAALSIENNAVRTRLDSVYILELRPFGSFEPADTGADRTSLPKTGQPPAPRFPTMERATLANGMEVVIAARKTVPAVNFNLMFDAGYAADQFAAPGTASLAMNMLDEGTASRNALEISESLAMIGATLGSGSNLDQSLVNMSALKANLDESLAIFADVILHPSFPQDEFNRLQKQQIAQIQREKVNPIQMALRVFPALLYGQGHAYGNPLTGSGTESSVLAMTKDDLVKFHQTWFKPNNATLVVVGDTTAKEILPKLEQAFGTWEPGDVPQKNISPVTLQSSPAVYLIDKPGALQSIILAGHVAPPKANDLETAIETMNTVLGGAFISRLNMNLRENKHWSYGAGTFLIDAEGQRPFLAYAPVQTDKTAESMIEVIKELREVTSDRPINEDELEMAKGNLTLALPGSWETNGEVMGAIAEIVRFGLADNYWDTYPGKVRSMSLDDMKAAAQSLIKTDHLVWVVVGDREKIEKGIKGLQIGEIRFLDVDGRPVK